MSGDERDDAVGESETEQRSGSGENDTLRKQLADYARTARTERGARGEFLGTRRGTSEEKIGEIDADDKKNESDGGPESDK